MPTRYSQASDGARPVNKILSSLINIVPARTSLSGDDIEWRLDLVSVSRLGEALDRIQSTRQACRRDRDNFKAEFAIDLFMHLLKTHSFLEADRARFGWRDEAKILYEKDTLLKDGLSFDAFQFARKRAGKRMSKVGRQRRGPDRRSIVKLYLRFGGGADLPLLLQFRD